MSQPYPGQQPPPHPEQHPGQPYPPPWPQQPKARKRRVWLWVLLGMLAAFVLMFAGCVALIGGAAVSIDAAGKEVHKVTYQAESSGRPMTVLYDTSTAGGVSNATASGVRSGWSIEVEHAGLLGPNMTVSLEPDFNRPKQNSGKVTCRILSNGRVVKEASASGEFATVSCNASAQELSGK